MRDVKRIPIFMNELQKIWESKFPDWRFGQVISNFFSWCFNIKKIDIFFLEEDKFLELFKEYVNESGEVY